MTSRILSLNFPLPFIFLFLLLCLWQWGWNKSIIEKLTTKRRSKNCHNSQKNKNKVQRDLSTFEWKRWNYLLKDPPIYTQERPMRSTEWKILYIFGITVKLSSWRGKKGKTLSGMKIRSIFLSTELCGHILLCVNYYRL